MRTAICKLCGKEGILDSFPHRGITMTVLKHYCPVKAAKKKEAKKREMYSVIYHMLKKPVDEMWYGWWPHAESILLKRYPYRPVDAFDIFNGVTLTDEEKVANKAFEDARLRYQQAIYNFLKEKNKLPTSKRIQIIAEKV